MATSASGEMPISISRDRAGNVSISTSAKDAKLMYQIAGKKAKLFTDKFNLKDGGTVIAWNRQNAALKTTMTFDKIENIPVEVIFASSQETGEEASRMTDGNPSTIWHTMYSVTVASYPHWVDFDCAETKTIKGFTYLPRQDGSPNGNIKQYRVQLSSDGKEWTEPVCEGDFDGSSKEKKVMLDKPQRARYLRFTALSSQNGADFASGAEFDVLAE